MKEEIRQKLTGAVIGLARTCENNEKTENTNRVFLEALTMAGDWSASIFDMSEMLEKVRNEKYTVYYIFYYFLFIKAAASITLFISPDDSALA